MPETPGFHGLFIGVDNYHDPSFRTLSFARRDAKVLHALFSDTFGEGATLLLDTAATRDKIMTELRRIKSAATESDIVVITFSGHGTRSHQLATWDSSGDRLAETAISCADFADHLAQITARILIVVLDCCFSGGMLPAATRRAAVAHEAKVVPADDGYISRETETEVDLLLRRVQGAGRFVFAASGPDEQAHEKAELGHGVLTYHVVRALLGEGVRTDDNQISMLSLADQVLAKVEWHRSGLRQRRQNPMLGGSMSRVRMPVLRPGVRYAAIEAALPSPATEAPTSLHRHGVPEAVTAIWPESIRGLNDVQLAAINEAGLLRGMSVLVSAPTASGKTLVGELAAVKAKWDGKRTVFLLSTRALVSEQYDRFRKLYAPIGIETIRATGELRDHLPRLLRGDYDFAVLTYEKFVSVLTAQPGLLHQIGVLVIDEIHTLFDPHRGPALETLLTWVRRGRGSAEMPQLVGLSAVLGEPEKLASWLGVKLVRGRHRSIPLIEYAISVDGRCRGRWSDGTVVDAPDPRHPFLAAVRGDTREEMLFDLVARLVAEDRQVIVFQRTREEARRTAGRLAETLRLFPADRTIAALRGGDTGNTYDRLRDCLAGGVAFHTADLSEPERRVIERAYREPGSEIRVLVATTTLAEGVNLPADAVVMSGLRHLDRDYTVSEYKNMAGRAGRTGDGHVEGMAFIVTGGGADLDEKWRRYALGGPDACRSALLAATYRRGILHLGPLILKVVSILQVDQGRDADPCDEREIREFLAHTLAAHQARLEHSPSPFPDQRIDPTVEELIRRGFLARAADGLALTRLGRIVVENGLAIRSARKVADVLTSIGPAGLTRQTLLCVAQLTDELHDAGFIWRSRDPQRDLNHTLGWLHGYGISPQAVTPADTDTDARKNAANARRALASLEWVRGAPLAQIERAMRATARGPGSHATRDPGPVLPAMRRAADVITAVIDIAYHLYPNVDLGDLREILPGQQELGIVEKHVPIARWLDGEIDRGVFVALNAAGLTEADAIVDADERILLDCVGDDRDLLRRILDAAKAARDEADTDPPPLADVCR